MFQRIAVTACSDALPPERRGKVEELLGILREMELEPVCSRYIFSDRAPFGVDGRKRAGELESFYRDASIGGIFDISGGNLANELLDELDYELLQRNSKPFWGYSDLTALLNAVYARTGNPAWLYQIRNMTGSDGARQREEFAAYLSGKDRRLLEVPWEGVQGGHMEGVLIGGNIRCFLKLAGTPYMPSFQGKLLFLESRSGSAALMASFFSQMKQMGVFQKIAGLLLGTFTELEKNGQTQELLRVVRQAAGTKLPVAKTRAVGHGEDSRCLIIGRPYACSF